MNIRLATTSDWQKFRDLRLLRIKTDPQAFGGDPTEEINRGEVEWRKRLESDSQFFFVAEESEIFVALAGAKEVGKDLWMLIGVYTRPEYRGRGLAKQVIIKVLDEAKVRGGIKMELMVVVEQKDAVHLYESLGFVHTKDVKGEKMADGRVHDIYQMEKKL